MIQLEMHEAQLFRILISCFGKERVIYGLSVNAVCEGEVPVLKIRSGATYQDWISDYKCLFAVTDEQYSPRLVIDFMPGFTGVIDALQAERRDTVKQLLNAKGVHYIGISREEFLKMQNPEARFDLYQLLEQKVEKGDIALKND